MRIFLQFYLLALTSIIQHLSNVNVCINLNPINKQKAKKQLDNALNKIKTNEQYAFSVSQKSESEQYYNAFLDQQQAIIDDVDFLKDMSIFILQQVFRFLICHLKMNKDFYLLKLILENQ